MGILTRRIAYDRKRLLESAERLGKGWRWRHALALYRQVLAAEPRNPEIHARVAPLLARSGRSFDAWDSYQIACEAFLQTGDESRARSLQQQAVRLLPKNEQACRELAKTEWARQQPDDAIRILHEGSLRLAGRRRTRGAAIVLLQDAREIDAWRPKIVLSLGKFLARDGRPGEALYLLDEMEKRARGETLCSVRALAWRIEPSFRHSWAWLKSVREVRRFGTEGPRGRRVSALSR